MKQTIQFGRVALPLAALLGMVWLAGCGPQVKEGPVTYSGGSSGGGTPGGAKAAAPKRTYGPVIPLKAEPAPGTSPLRHDAPDEPLYKR